MFTKRLTMRESASYWKQINAAFVNEQFSKLAKKWRKETSMLSVVHQKVNHPAYQKIIKMGRQALPFIFRELERKRDHWIWALHEITHEDPAKQGDNYKQAVSAWLEWGKEKGFL
jgi:hypothetical protein